MEKNIIDFVKLIVAAANFDNMSYPLLRFNDELTISEIIYPEKDKYGNTSEVSNSLIRKLEDHYNYAFSTSKIKLTYRIHLNDKGTISVTVKFIQ